MFSELTESRANGGFLQQIPANAGNDHSQPYQNGGGFLPSQQIAGGFLQQIPATAGNDHSQPQQNGVGFLQSQQFANILGVGPNQSETVSIMFPAKRGQGDDDGTII